jgi:hypothetical protein
MRTLIAEEMIKDIMAIIDDALIQPKKKFAMAAGFDPDHVTESTLFIIGGPEIDTSPPWVKWSAYLVKGQVCMLDEKDTAGVVGGCGGKGNKYHKA